MIKNECGKMPAFRYTHKQNKSIKITTSILFFLTLILTIFLTTLIGYYSLLICLPILFLDFFLVNLLCDPFKRAIKKYNRDGNYKNLVVTFDTFNYDAMHSVTYNYVKYIQGNIMFLYDKKKAYKLLDETTVPTIKQQAIIYFNIMLMYYINKKDNEGALTQLELLKDSIYYDKCKMIYDALMTDSKIENINKYFKTDTKKRFNNIVNLEILMQYYYKRNDINEAKKYASIIIMDYSDFQEPLSEARAIDNLKIKS